MRPQWRESYTKLKEFVEANKRWPDSQATGVESLLYQWCAKQRRERSHVSADAGKMQLLGEIHFPWITSKKVCYSPSDEAQLQWLEMYKRLVKFLNKHHRLPIKNEDAKLCDWYRYNSGKYEESALIEPKMVLMTRIADGLERLKLVNKNN